MTHTYQPITVSAATVEEAVENGLEQLGLTIEQVNVEILDAGSKGLFGLGSRPARVEILPLGPSADPIAVSPAPIEPPAEETRTDEKTAPMPSQQIAAAAVPDGVIAEAELSGDELELTKAARQVVEDLLERMKIKATVNAGIRKAIDDQDEDTVMVNIEGDDLSILIGRRSETLNALQYIASLILGKQMDSWVALVIDVQGYRARRERQLRQLARRMAEQALQSGRKQMLEPMTAAERRIIHLELRGNNQVETESVGEEPNRKITILPIRRKN